MRLLHISLNTSYPFRVPTQLIHIIHTFSQSLPAPTRTSHPCHCHISTGWHPIISTLTFHMPKPPQSTTPHHLSHALNTQKTVQIHTVLPILQRHPAHPSSPDFADLPSSPRFQSHMSMHSGHTPSVYKWGNLSESVEGTEKCQTRI